MTYRNGDLWVYAMRSESKYRIVFHYFGEIKEEFWYGFGISKGPEMVGI